MWSLGSVAFAAANAAVLRPCCPCKFAVVRARQKQLQRYEGLENLLVVGHDKEGVPAPEDAPPNHALLQLHDLKAVIVQAHHF